MFSWKANDKFISVSKLKCFELNNSVATLPTFFRLKKNNEKHKNNMCFWANSRGPDESWVQMSSLPGNQVDKALFLGGIGGGYP